MKSQTMYKKYAKLFAVVALTFMTLSLTACGQRVHLETPEDRIEDAAQY